MKYGKGCSFSSAAKQYTGIMKSKNPMNKYLLLFRNKFLRIGNPPFKSWLCNQQITDITIRQIFIPQFCKPFKNRYQSLWITTCFVQILNGEFCCFKFLFAIISLIDRSEEH